jgi:hypothetical protein
VAVKPQIPGQVVTPLSATESAVKQAFLESLRKFEKVKRQSFPCLSSIEIPKGVLLASWRQMKKFAVGFAHHPGSLESTTATVTVMSRILWWKQRAENLSAK